MSTGPEDRRRSGLGLPGVPAVVDNPRDVEINRRVAARTRDRVTSILDLAAGDNKPADYKYSKSGGVETASYPIVGDGYWGKLTATRTEKGGIITDKLSAEVLENVYRYTPVVEVSVGINYTPGAPDVSDAPDYTVNLDNKTTTSNNPPTEQRVTDRYRVYLGIDLN